MANKMTVSIDFDGVIHSYTSGWKGSDIIPDPPVEGIREAIAKLREDYLVVVVSSRANTINGLIAIKEYLKKHDIVVDEVSSMKVASVVHIDDRTICFDGNSGKLYDKVKNFKTWMEKDKKTEPKEPLEYGEGCKEINEIIDGNKCCFKFENAVITQYYGDEEGAAGKLTYDHICGAHNMPYGTKVFIPALKGKINDTGIFTVMDTGGHATDFDIYTKKDVGKINADVYVINWGTQRTAWSFTQAINYYREKGIVEKYNAAWSLYNKMKGCTINFWKYKTDDRSIKSQDWYDSKILKSK